MVWQMTVCAACKRTQVGECVWALAEYLSNSKVTKVAAAASARHNKKAHAYIFSPIVFNISWRQPSSAYARARPLHLPKCPVSCADGKLKRAHRMRKFDALLLGVPLPCRVTGAPTILCNVIMYVRACVSVCVCEYGLNKNGMKTWTLVHIVTLVLNRPPVALPVLVLADRTDGARAPLSAHK